MSVQLNNQGHIGLPCPICGNESVFKDTYGFWKPITNYQCKMGDCNFVCTDHDWDNKYASIIPIGINLILEPEQLVMDHLTKAWNQYQEYRKTLRPHNDGDLARDKIANDDFRFHIDAIHRIMAAHALLKHKPNFNK